MANLAIAKGLSPRDRALPALLSLFEEVSGMDLAGTGLDISFTELGLDSLCLTQISQALAKKFAVKVSIRQLMEGLNTLGSLASFVAENTSAGVPAEEVPVLPPHLVDTRPRAATSPEAPVPEAPATPGATSMIERVMQEQLQIMTEQLAVLRAFGAAPAPLPAPVQPHVQPVATPLAAPAKQLAAHGPFKPIAKGPSDGLTSAQQRYLKTLIDRYTKRTAESKRLTALHRPHLSDPRAVAGFKQIWKEMVYPIFTSKSEGSKIWDADGNEYVDFVMGFGASLFGHKPSFVAAAVRDQLEQGFEIGPTNPLAGEVAAMLREFTGMERAGFTNTGSEAVLAAVRIARTVTARDKIVIFAGSYHGIFDEVLCRPLTVKGELRTAPVAPGIPASAVSEAIVLDYGAPEALEFIRSHGAEIAAVVVEPVQGRHLDLQPREFLHELRRITEQTGSALIFDEVVTGFRVEPGGAQRYFGVRADLATYGKVVGGGLPIGIVAGSARFMDALDGGPWQYGDDSSPEAGVTFFAGTFVRHPLALAAAKAVLTHLKQAGPDLQKRLAERTATLADQLRATIQEFQAPYQVAQFSSLIQLTFPPEQKFAGLLFFQLRERGIHVLENRNLIITTAHTDEDFTRLNKALRESLAELRSAEFLAAPAPVEILAAVPVTAASAVATDPSGTFPLTEAQKEIWLAAQMGDAAALAYNESLKLEFHGPFDIDTFRTAAQRVVERHPIVLARISADGESQTVPSERTPLDVPLLDFSGLPDREARAVEAVRQESEAAFDLSAGPLIRARVIRLAADHHIAVWTVHHVICDGWSQGVLISELGKIYSALQTGVEPSLDTPVPFRQYALDSQPVEQVQEATKYWQEQFKDIPLPLDLPTDRPRPAARNGAASTVTLAMNDQVLRSLRRVAGQQRTSLVVILMAGLETLLHRLTGQTDIVLGLGAAGQAITGNSCLVGHCLNLLPVRTQLQGLGSFQENLAAVKKSVLDAYDHNQATIGGLLQHIPVKRVAGRLPLVEILFNLDRDPGAAEFHGLTFKCERNSKRGSHFDLFVNFVEESSGFHVECDYNTSLFDAATVERWLRHYQTLMEGVAANPAQELGELPILSKAEREDLVVNRNRTAVELPPVRTLHQWFQQQARKTPDARAVTAGGKGLTYAELDSRANTLAHHLAQLGVGPGTLVGVCLTRSLDMMIALLGILKAGGAYVPLDPDFPQDRLAHMVEDSRMSVLVTHGVLADRLAVKPAVVVRLDSGGAEMALSSAVDAPATHVSPQDLAYVLYTSGSTGKPKGVEVSHLALVNFLYSMQSRPGLSSSDTLLAVTTLSFDIAGLELYLPLVTGAHVVIASAEDARIPAQLIERMREFGCTVMQATPATWRALIDSGWAGSPKLKILCGGEGFPADLAQALLSRCAELWNMYGPTETTIWSTIHPVTAMQGSVPIGRPIANTQVFVLDQRLGLVPPGVVGELYIGGTGLAQGYLRREELTAERFIPSPFDAGARLYRTGDLARWLSDSTLECLGRVDNQVKIRGFRIELGEIEAVLNHHEAVRQCVVVASESVPGDKQLVAYLELHPGSTPSLAELRAHVKSQLPGYMTPAVFVTLDRLPLTPNGKIDRKALPAPEAGRLETASDVATPRDPVEQMLAGLWSKILKVKRVGPQDNFFDLGGHSLAAVRLLAEVQKLTGKTLPLATLFQASTVEALAEILRRDGWTPSWSSLVAMRERGTGDPLFLVHGAEGNVLLYRQLIERLGSDRPVYGLQSQNLNGEGQHPTSIREMAAHYVQELMSVQPDGPYFLAGYCLGGTIAFEMAQQLTAMGKKVEVVIMLDSYNEAVVSRIKARLQAPVYALQNVWFHAANLVAVRGEDRKKFLRQKLDTSITRAGIRVRAFANKLRHWGGRTQHNDYLRLALQRINDQAAMEYVPRPYQGRVAVIRSKASFAGHNSPSLGWNTVVPDGLEILELPVYPKGMLVEPFCDLLADKVRLCLEHA